MPKETNQAAEQFPVGFPDRFLPRTERQAWVAVVLVLVFAAGVIAFMVAFGLKPSSLGGD